MEFFVDWRTIRRKQNAVDEEAMLESIAAAVGLAPSRLWTRRLLGVFPIRPKTCFRELRLAVGAASLLSRTWLLPLLLLVSGLGLGLGLGLRLRLVSSWELALESQIVVIHIVLVRSSLNLPRMMSPVTGTSVAGASIQGFR